MLRAGSSKNCGLFPDNASRFLVYLSVTSSCHSFGGYSPVYHLGGPGSFPVQSCGIFVRQNGTGVRLFPPKTAVFPCQNHSTGSLCSFVRPLLVPWNLNNCQHLKGTHLRKRTKRPDQLWGPNKGLLCKI